MKIDKTYLLNDVNKQHVCRWNVPREPWLYVGAAVVVVLWPEDTKIEHLHDSKKARNTHDFKELTVYLSDYDASQKFCNLFKSIKGESYIKSHVWWSSLTNKTFFLDTNETKMLLVHYNDSSAVLKTLKCKPQLHHFEFIWLHFDIYWIKVYLHTC